MGMLFRRLFYDPYINKLNTMYLSVKNKEEEMDIADLSKAQTMMDIVWAHC